MSAKLFIFAPRGGEYLAAPDPLRGPELHTLGEKRGTSWRPTPVVVHVQDESGRERTATDWPYLAPDMPAIRTAVLPAVSDHLQAYAEFLPLDCSEFPLTAVNVLVIVDALDAEATEGARFPDGRFMFIDRYAFHASKLPDIGLFRLTTDLRGPVICTEATARLLQDQTSGPFLEEI